jgi:hypothetical protein
MDGPFETLESEDLEGLVEFERQDWREVFEGVVS